MSRFFLLRGLATIAFAATIAINVLANSLPINGLNTGEVSNLYPSLFTPTGLTFSIWSVIYFLLTGFVVLMWNRLNDETITKLIPWFILSCVFNFCWILAWHYLYATLSVAIMFCLLSVLIYIFRTLHSLPHPNSNLKTRIWLVLPFTFYLSWICVATIANISAFLVSLDWNGGFFSPQAWTVFMMAVAALLGAKITYDFKTPFFSLVIIWAILGIFLRWRGSDHDFIVYSSIILIILLTFSLIYSMRRGGPA